jgi:hypothetical protein
LENIEAIRKADRATGEPTETAILSAALQRMADSVRKKSGKSSGKSAD